MEASQTQYNEEQLSIDPDYVKHVAAELASLTQEQLDARYDAAEKGSIQAELIEAELARRDDSMLPEPITRIYVEGKRSAIQVAEAFDEVTNQLESGASLLRLKARTKGAHLEVAIPASRVVSVTGAWSL